MTHLTNVAFIRAKNGKTQALGSHLLALLKP